MRILKQLLLLSLLIGSYGMGVPTQAQEPKLEGVNWKPLSETVTLHGGRLKPFDEFAREMMLLLTGSRSYHGYNPSEWVLSIMVHPAEWANEPIIRISNDEVKKQLLITQEGKWVSPNQLIHNNVFLQYAESILNKGDSKQVTSKGIDVVTAAQNPRAEELKRVVDRVSIFQALTQGALWAVTPRHSLHEPWGSLFEGMKEKTPQTEIAYALLRGYLDHDVSAVNAKSLELKNSIVQALASTEFQYSDHKNKAEVFYNQLRPFLWSMVFYLLAGLLWMLAGFHRVLRMFASVTTGLAIFVHTLGFGLRMYISGRPPVTNMYESIIWVSFGVIFFAVILFYKFKNPVIMVASTIIAGLSLYAGDAAPLVMDPTIRPLMPVLRSNYWLTIHVLTITAGYAAFFLGMGISNYVLYLFFRKKRLPDQADVMKMNIKINQLNLINYRTLQIGTVLLAAGTILGGIWADYSWGRFWGWDPKEVWALIALLAYMAILHARYAGWMNTFLFPLWSVICFSTVVMAWYGVNFVLGVGLHSYGFSAGGQSFMATFLAVQLVYCLLIYIDHKIKHSHTPTLSSQT